MQRANSDTVVGMYELAYLAGTSVINLAGMGCRYIVQIRASIYVPTRPPFVYWIPQRPPRPAGGAPPTGIILFPFPPPSHHHYPAPPSATCILHLHPIVSLRSRALAQLFRDFVEINTRRPPHLLNAYSSEQWVALFLFLISSFFSPFALSSFTYRFTVDL